MQGGRKQSLSWCGGRERTLGPLSRSDLTCVSMSQGPRVQDARGGHRQSHCRHSAEKDSGAQDGARDRDGRAWGCAAGTGRAQGRRGVHPGWEGRLDSYKVRVEAAVPVPGSRLSVQAGACRVRLGYPGGTVRRSAAEDVRPRGEESEGAVSRQVRVLAKPRPASRPLCDAQSHVSFL